MGVKSKISDPEAQGSEGKGIPRMRVRIPKEIIWRLEQLI